MTSTNPVADGTFIAPSGTSGHGMACGSLTYMSRVYSRGWLFDRPVEYSVPFLFLQIAFMIAISKVLYYLLRPFKQPRIICAIIGGIVLGSNTIASSNAVSSVLFLTPDDLILLLRTLTEYALVVHIFLLSVKMDLSIVTQSGSTVIWIGVSSMLVPFIFVAVTSYCVSDYIVASVARGRFIIFLAVTISVTAFPVLGEILAEINIITTELGRLGMASSMINGFFWWFCLILFHAMKQYQHAGWLGALYYTLSLFSMLGFIAFVIRPYLMSVIRKTPRGKQVSKGYFVAVFTTMMVICLITDAIGMSPVDGPLFMGLILPKGPPLGSALVEKADLIVSEILMPLLYYTIGNLTVLPTWGALVDYLPLMFVFISGYVVKLMGTIVSAIACKLSVRDALMLGLIMNLQGIIEIMTLFHFTHGELLDTEGFTILLLLTMVSTAIHSPLLTMFYNPMSENKKVSGGLTIERLNSHSELLILACIHNEGPVPSLISLIEASSAAGESPMYVYALHLEELQGRHDSTLISHRDKKGFINPTNMDRLLNAFTNYEQETKGRVVVLPFTSISPYKSMHQDICMLAAKKRVALIIVPYPRNDAKAEFQPSDLSVRGILPDILAQSPCSVGILVHQTVNRPLPSWLGNFRLKIGILFWGGSDDREALTYAKHIGKHNNIHLKITQFTPKIDIRDKVEQTLDNRVLEDFKIAHTYNPQVVFANVNVTGGEDTLLAIKSMDNDYDLLIVGRKQGVNSNLTEELGGFSDSPELGTIGELLSSSDFTCSLSVLIIHQYNCI